MTERRAINSHTALRGVAAVLVVCYHLQFGAMVRLPIETATCFFKRGYLWVDLFFVLSGFILSYVDRTDDERLRWSMVASFWRSRFARIYPLHICCLAALVLLAAMQSGIMAMAGRPSPIDWSAKSLTVLLAQAALLNAWLPAGGWNIPTWSISAEVVAYLLFPFLVRARLAAPYPWTVSLAIGCAAFFTTVALTTGSLDVTAGPMSVLRCLAGFSLGLLAYQHRHWTVRMRSASLTAIQLATVAATLAVFALQVSDPLATPLFLLLVLTSWEDRGGVARLLTARPLVWLGEVSYSIYLVHVPLIEALGFAWVRSAKHLPFSDITLRSLWIVLVLTTVLAVSAATFHYVERPARQWFARRWLGHRAPAIAMVPPAP